MGSSNWVTIWVDEILRETEAAFLCLIEGEEVWLPKSQISDPEDWKPGDCDAELSVTEWIAREKGLGE